jgi:RNA polymerase sigma-70 factor (ECF subfamily)
MTEDEEQRLIDAARQGDVTAFNQLVHRYEGRIYHSCYRILGDADSAADAAQDTFLSAFRNLKRFRGGSFRSWIFRIATNTCYDVLRARKRRPTVSLNAPQHDNSDTNDNPLPLDPPDTAESPDEVALRKELAAVIQQGIQLLPDDQRIALVLSDIQGMSYQEIADITETSLGTIKSRISRGRARLRDFLKTTELLPQRYRYRE